ERRRSGASPRGPLGVCADAGWGGGWTGPLSRRVLSARGHHAWREAQGGRLGWLAGDRMVQVLSGPQVATDEALGEAVPQGKDAGLLPEATVRLCGIGEGAAWLWKQVQAVLPQARQGLDDAHGSADLPKV